MTRLEWFDNGNGLVALELGIISSSMYFKYVTYKVYLDKRAEGMPHMEAIEVTADQTKNSISNTWKAVSFFVKSNDVKII